VHPAVSSGGGITIQTEILEVVFLRYGFVTDIGKLRRQNEDNVLVHSESPMYAIVADGMGGHNAGEVASKLAIDTISEVLNTAPKKKKIDFEDKLRDAFVLANKKIYDYAEENSKLLGMGTTTVTAVIHNKKLFIGNVGDSRAYIIKDGEIRQISIDHSYVWQLVMRGDITEHQAKRHPKRNYITRAMGTEKFVAVDTFVEDYNGGVVLLCSDGLSNLVENNEMKNLISEYDDLQKAAEALVALANERGGNDNITVALLEN